jgi:hypothetical protein
MLVITRCDDGHHGGAHALRRPKAPLVSGGGSDLALVSDPEVLVARRYGAFRAEHGIGPDETSSARLRAESGEPERVVYGCRR